MSERVNRREGAGDRQEAPLAPPGWRQIDWHAPWLAPYAALGTVLDQHLLAGGELVAALNELARAQGGPLLRAGPLRFVPHDALPAGEAYESFVFRTGCVPTRGVLHDVFNALVWLRWPGLKGLLNEWQAREIARRGVGGRRGAVRDAITLLDESGALLSGPPVLAGSLARRDWPALFQAHRAQWGQATMVIVGHALLERLVAPRKALCAHVLCLPACGQGGREAWHDALAPLLRADQGKPFLPMPVLGVPGWWQDNEAPSFYDDPAVFRAARAAG